MITLHLEPGRDVYPMPDGLRDVPSGTMLRCADISFPMHRIYLGELLALRKASRNSDGSSLRSYPIYVAVDAGRGFENRELHLYPCPPSACDIVFPQIEEP